jgi:colanic acid biosynthesis protein WcaH
VNSPQWLPDEQFQLAVEALPLISVDLCLVNDGHMLLGKRNNKPALGWWFTPGGRIRKGEAWNMAFMRIAQEELGLVGVSVEDAVLMGVWDHFYDESAFSDSISTHYVNMPHYFLLDKAKCNGLSLPCGDSEQHSEWCWSPIEKAAKDAHVHSYVRIYAQWLLDHSIL